MDDQYLLSSSQHMELSWDHLDHPGRKETGGFQDQEEKKVNPVLLDLKDATDSMEKQMQRNFMDFKDFQDKKEDLRSPHRLTQDVRHSLRFSDESCSLCFQ
ncbi:hypothetical protein OJAV_G00009130 [Oryzias javanicus]|uniref:Uncharacterized protein n=1 Tax=Oryzias javanicus TaxID=123683 RepID=A0A3S2MWQ8_ORYJA|nr:hypothetical protein OJAV_G00009130 [Oryzias javanicus]